MSVTLFGFTLYLIHHVANPHMIMKFQPITATNCSTYGFFFTGAILYIYVCICIHLHTLHYTSEKFHVFGFPTNPHLFFSAYIVSLKKSLRKKPFGTFSWSVIFWI